MDSESGNDRRAARSVIIRVREDIPWADFERIPETICPACVVIYVHLSHPSPSGLVTFNFWVFSRWGIVFLGVAFSTWGSAEESKSRLSGRRHFEPWFQSWCSPRMHPLLNLLLSWPGSTTSNPWVAHGEPKPSAAAASAATFLTSCSHSVIYNKFFLFAELSLAFDLFPLKIFENYMDCRL